MKKETPPEHFELLNHDEAVHFVCSHTGLPAYDAVRALGGTLAAPACESFSDSPKFYKKHDLLAWLKKHQDSIGRLRRGSDGPARGHDSVGTLQHPVSITRA